MSGAPSYRRTTVTRPDPNEPPATPAQAAFEELGRISFAEHSLQSVIQTVTDVAARVIPGDPFTSVTIVTHGAPRTVAASDELALELDQTQYRLGDGPCLTAANRGEPVEVVDTFAEDRWPEFAAPAAGVSCRGILFVTLPGPERVTGAR